MADCRLCGTPAGFLRKVHPQCQSGQAAARAAMLQQAAAAALNPAPPAQLSSTLNALAAQHHLPPAAVEQILYQALLQALEQAMDDHLLTPEEENSLQAFARQFHIRSPQYEEQLAQAVALREIAAGNLPQPAAAGPAPFIYQKGEKAVWVFQDIQYAERVTRRERTGTSHGVSIRLAKGLYYSPRTFRSRPVEYQETVHVDTGTMAFTNKHLYFSGPEKSFRIPYGKIVSVSGYDNGIAIVRDGVRAQPQYFLVGPGKGWFMSNLFNALAQP